MIQQLMPADWQAQLTDYFASTAYLKLDDWLTKNYPKEDIYPQPEQLFRALDLTPYQSVKICLLGQDPYHTQGVADGLAFSTDPSVEKLPPSLRNIYQALTQDLEVSPPETGDLSSWATQGVLLLNTVLTVAKGQANAHRNCGWEELTDAIIQAVSQKDDPVLFVLWGQAAQKKRSLIDEDRHSVLTAPHPSPLSAYRGFFDSQPFLAMDRWLADNHYAPIDWVNH